MKNKEEIQEIINKYAFDIYEIGKTRNHNKLPLIEFWRELQIVDNIYNESLRDVTFETPFNFIKFGEWNGTPFRIEEERYKGNWEVDVIINEKYEN